MLKIAFIHNTFPSGGAERITVDIAEYLACHENYKVFVYASRIAEANLTDTMKNVLTIRQIPTQAIPAVRARRIEQNIIEDGIDILVQVTKAVQGIEGIKKRTGIKTIVSCHGEPFWQRYAIVNRRKKGLIRRIMWGLYNRKRYEDGTLAMKKAVNRTLREYRSCDAYTVLCNPYKLETAERLGIDHASSHIYPIENPEYSVENVDYDKEKIVLFCGRFENWSKRIDRLLRIWAKVQGQMSDWKLMLVGDGEDWDKLKRMAGEMALERVYFEGRRKNVSDYYRTASIVVLTSDTEGWPLTLTEAQAHGCICVAFDCTSGIKEILSPETECGFTVPSYDEDRYAQILMEVMQLPEEKKMAIRKKAVERRSHYGPENIAEKWKTLFDQLSVTCQS